MDRIGFIGLGNMGRPMASNLVRKGFPLVAFDVNARARSASSSTSVRAPPASVRGRRRRRATSSITMLPNSASVEEVLDGPAGLLAHLRPAA